MPAHELSKTLHIFLPNGLMLCYTKINDMYSGTEKFIYYYGKLYNNYLKEVEIISNSWFIVKDGTLFEVGSERG